MWVPKSEDELVRAVTSGSIEESEIFDAKKELPTKNAEIAKDIAAMATDGGVLIYGIDEDEQGRPTVLNPIPLVNQTERITSIVQTSIDEPPRIHISTIPTTADPSVGYLIVQVPLSERAPHMVIVKGENRFYGRNGTTNVILSKGQIDRLYERQRRWDVDRDALLEQEIAEAPLQPHDNFAYLHLFARPVARNNGLLEKAVRENEALQEMLQLLVRRAIDHHVFPRNVYSPDFVVPGRWMRRVEGMLCHMDEPSPRDDPRAPAYILDLQLDFDGGGHLFCGRAAEGDSEGFLFFETLVAGNTTRFLALLGVLYERARYMGMVDIGVAVTGLKGAVPYRGDTWSRLTRIRYDRDAYKRTTRVSALEIKDDAQAIARSLLMPLFAALSQSDRDPFPKKDPQ